MPSGDGYYADPGALRRTLNLMDSIHSATTDLQRDFDNGASATSDWPGKDDSYAEKAKPQEANDRLGSVDTLSQICDALRGIIDKTKSTLDNMEGTQGGTVDAINDALNGANGGAGTTGTAGGHGKH